MTKLLKNTSKKLTTHYNYEKQKMGRKSLLVTPDAMRDMNVTVWGQEFMD